MLGLQYSLIAIGFTLFFGILHVVVFCHGAFYILGTFIGTALLALAFSIGSGSPLLFAAASFMALFLAMVLTGVVGITAERITIRPFRNAPAVMSILTTFAAGIVIEQLLKLFYPEGSNPQVFPELFPDISMNFGTFHLSINEVVIFLVAIFCLAGMFFFIKKTRMGSHVNAISQDFEAASMVGIDVNKSIAITFFIGASLAAIAGFMNGIYYKIFRYDMGLTAGIKGFSSAVVGGLGSVFGAVLGGFLMAFVETFSAAYIPGGSSIRDVFSFLVVLLFLIFKPNGILGKIQMEKV